MSALGVLGVLGPAIGGGIEAYGASLQSHKARRMAREMASTQYQTAVRDMRAAGLNPMAIFGNGGGSTPGLAQQPYANPFEGAGEVGEGLAESFTKGDVAVSKEAAGRIAQANAKAAESDADLKLAENSAYKAALSTDAGRLGAVQGRYGSMGAAGEVMGMLGIGNALGGESSARSTKGSNDRKAAIDKAVEQWAPRVPTAQSVREDAARAREREQPYRYRGGGRWQ